MHEMHFLRAGAGTQDASEPVAEPPEAEAGVEPEAGGELPAHGDPQAASEAEAAAEQEAAVQHEAASEQEAAEEPKAAAEEDAEEAAAAGPVAESQPGPAEQEAQPAVDAGDLDKKALSTPQEGAPASSASPASAGGKHLDKSRLQQCNNVARHIRSLFDLSTCMEANSNLTAYVTCDCSFLQ